MSDDVDYIPETMGRFCDRRRSHDGGVEVTDANELKPLFEGD